MAGIRACVIEAGMGRAPIFFQSYPLFPIPDGIPCKLKQIRMLSGISLYLGGKSRLMMPDAPLEEPEKASGSLGI
jgi:hypothetical protein